MPGKKKKDSNSAFYMYMMAMKSSLEKRLGRSVPLNECAQILSPDWNVSC